MSADFLLEILLGASMQAALLLTAAAWWERRTPVAERDRSHSPPGRGSGMTLRRSS
jgi:hypothetical protein